MKLEEEMTEKENMKVEGRSKKTGEKIIGWKF